MNNCSEMNRIELIYFIVNDGQSGKLIHEAKQCGIMGSTVMLGMGTVNNHILDFLGLSDVRKEIVLMLADSNTADQTLDRLNKLYKFEKPNHGIAFTTSIGSTVGTSSIKCGNEKEERGIDRIMYHSITIIVDKGKAEDVIDAAVEAGSKGGTIINGRGSGIHETSKVFMMDIEPEKEIVLILSEAEKTDAIVASIKEKLQIDEPGNGIIFIQEVLRTYGIYK
jgi:nitrogen regulatory protein PII